MPRDDEHPSERVQAGRQGQAPPRREPRPILATRAPPPARVAPRDPAVVGRVVRFDDRAVTIAGVMGKDFTFPDRDAQLWMPLGIATVESGATVIRAMIFNAVARLHSSRSAQ